MFWVDGSKEKIRKLSIASTLGSEGSSEAGDVSVEVVRVVTYATSSSGEGVRDGTFG